MPGINLELRFLLVVQWGKGWIHVRESFATREEAFGRVSLLRRSHNKQHQKGNTPTFYVYEREGFCAVEPRASKKKLLASLKQD